MMKLNSKLSSAFLSGALIFSLMSPAVSFAREASEGPRGMDSREDLQEKKEQRIQLFNKKTDDSQRRMNSSDGTNFCSRLEAGIQKTGKEFNRLNDDLKTRREEQGKKLEERRGNIDQRFDDSREKWESNRQENFDKLMARATTDGQKAAVEAFKTTIQSALKTRYAAVDAAREAYRKAVDELIAGRKTTLESAKNTLKSATDAAIAKAKADCAVEGANGATIKQAFHDALKVAQDAFKTSTQSIEKPNDALQNLIDTRNEAIRKAHEAFKVTQEAALKTLKAAFPQTTTTP